MGGVPVITMRLEETYCTLIMHHFHNLYKMCLFKAAHLVRFLELLRVCGKVCLVLKANSSTYTPPKLCVIGFSETILQSSKWYFLRKRKIIHTHFIFRAHACISIWTPFPVKGEMQTTVD